MRNPRQWLCQRPGLTCSLGVRLSEPRPSRRLSDGRFTVLTVSCSGSSIEAPVLPAGSIGLRRAVQPAGSWVLLGLDLRSWVVALTRLPLCSLMNLQSPTYATKFTAA
jgi:hypothetical protein